MFVCSYRMCNIFMAIEKVKTEKLAFWPNATEHDLSIAPSYGETCYYTIQGICGQIPSTSPQHVNHTKSINSAKVMHPGIREALGLGREQGWAKAGVSGTGDFLAVLGKLIVETALSKW